MTGRLLETNSDNLDTSPWHVGEYASFQGFQQPERNPGIF